MKPRRVSSSSLRPLRALVFTNIGYAESYDYFLELPVSVQIGGIGLNKTLVHWINDGLMAIFFFLVGIGNQA